MIVSRGPLVSMKPGNAERSRACSVPRFPQKSEIRPGGQTGTVSEL